MPVVTPRFGAECDIDMLVKFEPERGPGSIGLAGMEIELSELLGRKVDLCTPRDLSRYCSDEVVATAFAAV
jgi:predicted nucleotidyltransferase